MDIKVNGKTRPVAPGATLADLLAALGLEEKRLAIEHNGRVLAAEADRGKVALAEGDTIEIVRLVGGG